ncbi:FkbM family methyltransferase [Spirosoma spitsbergense]|uniref:FkbM family methyltransferase n=1 Tax=Spirosoma spitsbergense TaxID=431554 RepID=UPI00036425BF|nr:FkbM family methyltransferase [Spirosoma spitsbergense]
MIRQLVAPYWHIFYDLLMAGRRKKFYGTLVKPGDLCFDIGANIGDRTSIFLALNTRVVAVEPQPACVQRLERRFGNQITIVAKGVGAEEGYLPMHLSNANTLSSFSEEWINKVQQERFAQYEWNETITVPIITLDKLIATYGVPSFCKVDVEGFEVQVLRGLTQPLPMISLEYTVPEAKENLLEVIERLDSLSESMRFNYSPGESMRLALPDYIPASDFKQLVNSPNFKKSKFGDVYAKSSQ